MDHPSDRRVLGALALIIFVRVLGITLIITGFFAYAEGLGSGATPLEAGLAFGAYLLALALFLAPVGHLSDRFGRRAVMTGGLLVAAAGAILAALAPTWWLLAAGRFVSGVGAVNGVALAVAGETGEPEKRTRRFALLGAAAGGGVVLGLVLGLVLQPLIGVRGLLIGFAIANVLVLPVVRAIPGGRPTTSAPRLRPERAALILGVAAFCVNLSLTMLLLLLRGLLHLSEVAFTWALLAMIVPGGLGMFAASRLADRGRAREVGIAAAALLGLAPLVIILGPALGLVAAVVAGMLFFLAHSSLSSLLPSLLAGALTEGRRGGARSAARDEPRPGGLGAAQGVQSTLQYLGSFVGSAAGGALVAMALPLAAAFAVSGAVCAVAVVLVTSSGPQTSVG